MKANRGDSKEMRRHRIKMRSAFNGVAAPNPHKGMSDVVAVATRQNAAAARRAEAAWIKSLSRKERRYLRAA